MIEYHDAMVRVRYARRIRWAWSNHANYLIWFRGGPRRIDRALGLSTNAWKLKTMPHRGADAHCRYHHSAVYDEVMRIPDAHRGNPDRVIKFSYEVIRDADGKVLANGETTHVICGSNGRPKCCQEYYSVLAPSSCAPDRSNA